MQGAPRQLRRRHSGSSCTIGSSPADRSTVSTLSLIERDLAHLLALMRTHTEFKGKRKERSRGLGSSLLRPASWEGGKPSCTVGGRCRYRLVATWSQVHPRYSSRTSSQSSRAARNRGVRVRCTIRALECPGRLSQHSGDAAMHLRGIGGSRSSRETGARIASARSAITCRSGRQPGQVRAVLRQVYIRLVCLSGGPSAHFHFFGLPHIETGTGW